MGSHAETNLTDDQMATNAEPFLTVNNTAMALVAAAEAEVKAQCAMAIKFPRDLDVVREKLLKECKRPSFARSALYAKPVGNSKVTGLSIRFAEAAIASMGHIHTTIKTLAETPEYRKIEIRVWDAQNMISYADEATIEKTIERRSIPKGQEYIRTRLNTSGDLLYIIRATEDDLLNKVNSAKSKSIRNSGLRMVPGWLLDECKGAVSATARDADAADPDAAKKQIFDSFAQLGVSVDDIKKYLGHDAATLQPAELQVLRELFVAVRDGETTLAAIFRQREQDASTAPSGKRTKALKERLKSSSQETGETEGRRIPPEIPAADKPQEAPFNLQPPAPSPADWIPRPPDNECTIGRDSIARIDPRQGTKGKYWLAENGSGGRLTVFDKQVAAHVASMLNRDLLVAVKKSGQYTNLVAIKTLEAK